MSEQLKPCPFCGGEGNLISHEDPRVTNYGYEVDCGDCGARGPLTDCAWNGDTSAAKSGAVLAWNMRAPSPIVAALEAERDAVARRFASGRESMSGHSTANFIGGIGRAIDIVKELSK